MSEDYRWSSHVCGVVFREGASACRGLITRQTSRSISSFPAQSLLQTRQMLNIDWFNLFTTCNIYQTPQQAELAGIIILDCLDFLERGFKIKVFKSGFKSLLEVNLLKSRSLSSEFPFFSRNNNTEASYFHFGCRQENLYMLKNPKL